MDYQDYERAQSFVEDVLEFHPSALGVLDGVQRSALWKFFALAEDFPSSLRDHFLAIEQDDDLRCTALEALGRILEELGLESVRGTHI